ncbi:hypothetical protein [Streptomyces sp. NBC_00391]|uniref:hypothetical protein n=1 Tax=Streptomyces sp. NBC_00391 TaxID=2903647 RepID=UPI002E1B40D0
MSNAFLAPGMPPVHLGPSLLFPASLGELQNQARDALAAGTVPVPAVALRCQQRVATRVRDQVEQEAKDGARLYVLDFAGPAPRVKIGRARSTAHLVRRIQRHLREKNKHGYALIDARVTPLAADVVRAEQRALRWMSHAYQVVPRTREEFLDADVVIADIYAGLGVFRFNPHEEFAGPVPLRLGHPHRQPLVVPAAHLCPGRVAGQW